MEQLNFGIIGFGKMGRTRADSITRLPNCAVTKIYDVQKDITPPAGATFAADPMEIILDPSIHAVCVCTPNDALARWTIAALEQKKHVLCEKPPGRNLAELRTIVDTEKKSGCTLKFGFNHRHHESIIKTKEIIDSGEFGKVLWVRGRYGKSVDKNFFSNWRADKDIAGGGIFLDQGIHMLDLFLLACGNFDEVHAYVSNLYWNLEIEDNVFAIFRNKEGQVGSLHSTMTQWRHLFSLEVFLERGYMTLNGIKTSTNSYGEEILTIAKNRSAPPEASWDAEEHFKFEVDNSWNLEMEEFVGAVRTKTPIRTGNTDDALKLMKLVEMVYANK